MSKRIQTYLLFVCASILFLGGCSSKHFSEMTKTGSGVYNRSDLYPVVSQREESVMYNMTLTYKELSMNGYMVATIEEDESIHVVCTAFMGMTLFDFTINEDAFVVNSCMEQLDRAAIKLILKKDLVTLFTRNVKSTFKAKKYADSSNTKFGYKVRTSTGKACYIVDNEAKRAESINLSGGPLRAEFKYTNESIVISHPRLGLEMTLFQ